LRRSARGVVRTPRLSDDLAVNRDRRTIYVGRGSTGRALLESARQQGGSGNRPAGVGRGPAPVWPAEPPHDAVRVPVLDSEPRTAVAALSGVVLWVRTSERVSRPIAFDLAMP
jgi:hypothetical protein